MRDESEDIDVRPLPCASAGEVELFIQPVAITPRLRIYGSTPVARAAAWLARETDFDPLTDEEAADRAVLDAAGAPACPALPTDAYVLIATQGDGDEGALEDTLRSPARAVLLVASRRKAQRLRAVMADRGISEERLKVIRAPAGPHTGAITPNEIALAAVGGLIAARRGQDLTSGAKTQSADPSGEAILVAPADARNVGHVNPVCGRVVDPATALSALSYGGQTHYFCRRGCREELERNPEKYLQIAAKMGQRRVAAVQ